MQSPRPGPGMVATMSRNKSAIFLHLVWAAWDRLPMMDPAIEDAVHRCIEAEARQLGCAVLALNGTPQSHASPGGGTRHARRGVVGEAGEGSLCPPGQHAFTAGRLLQKAGELRRLQRQPLGDSDDCGLYPKPTAAPPHGHPRR